MRSGLSVPCARNTSSGLRFSAATSASATFMNVSPMIRRFCSGSVTARSSGDMAAPAVSGWMVRSNVVVLP